MKSFLLLFCVLLAAANVINASDDQTACAVATYDAIKAVTLRLIAEFDDRLVALRSNYTACNELPLGGQRENCHLEYGRSVVNVLLGLRRHLGTIKDVTLRFALDQLDEYFVCRESSIHPFAANLPSYCAVVRTDNC